MRPWTLFIGAVALCFGILTKNAPAEDWPMWRHDASRTAATSQKLPEHLQLVWTKQLAPPKPAWPEDPKLLFDAAYQPVVVGSTLLVGTNSDDSVMAIDTHSGREKWRFFADGPVRMAPLVADGRVYVGADDGTLYCLAIADGSLIWKIPSPFGRRTALGNERLISLWPIRGGLVIHDHWLYYTAGVWPFEGAALFRVNLNEPSAVSSAGQVPVEVVTTFTDDAPQGYLAVCDQTLFVPGGRGPATCLDIKGPPSKLPNFGADNRTDYHLTLSENWLFQGQRVIDFKTRKPLPLECPRPVTDGSLVYFVQKDNVVATDLSKPRAMIGKGPPTPLYTALWHVPTIAINEEIARQNADAIPPESEPSIDLVADGDVVGHWGKALFSIRARSETTPAHLTWMTVIDGTPGAVITADGKLFVSTVEGQLLCFAEGEAVPLPVTTPAGQSIALSTPTGADAAEMRKVADVAEGYAIVWSIGSNTQLIDELLRHEALRVIVIDPSANKVAAFRHRLAALGHYGSRVSARVGDIKNIDLPPYLANLVVCGDSEKAGLGSAEAIATKVLPTLRPYGGLACLELAPSVCEKLEKLIHDQPDTGITVERQGKYTLLKRSGALPGAADWTHEYGDAANSLMSQDKLVASPLGVLWFGGPASDPRFFFDRHLWPPSPLVVGGRMFLQGVATLAAVDIYTGRVMWSVPIEHGSSPGRRVNFDTRNNDIGYHMVAAEDALYLGYPTRCLRLDPATGRTMATFELPEKNERWGEIEVIKDRLLVPIFDVNQKQGKVPTRLVSLNRKSGAIVWSYTPQESCPLVAAGNDRVYLYDGILHDLYQDMKRKGQVPKGGLNRYLKALDAETGKVLWQEPIGMVATWLSHSADTDIVVASNHEGMEARDAKTGKSLWQKSATSVGFKGHPESRWDRLILWNDRIIDQRGPGLSYDLNSGKTVTRPHPITGDAVPWEFTTTSHHCGYAIASQNMLTFRDGTAGYCNVADGMTTRLPGFRSGCRSSLIPAGGVLNAPNMAQGCACGFSIFTSLALVHAPEVEAWSFSPLKPPSGRVTRLGINLGAPGDRLAPDGTLWLDWPSNNQPGYVLPGVAGPSPDLDVKMEADSPRWFRLPTGLMRGTGPNWVASSGVEGIHNLTIKLGVNGHESSRYTVRLVFAEPDEKKPGDRVFDVAINGKPVLQGFDLNREPAMRHVIVVREFAGIVAAGQLRVDLKASSGRTLLCGVEIVAETKQSAN